jgi:quercetin dioxygenase-like cupin family protein
MTTATPERQQLILGADSIHAKRREPMHPGVTYALLWREGRDSAGMMWLEPGAVVPEHTHDVAEHHVWLVDGHARVAGHTLGPGAYWHVPAGVAHEVRCPSTHGCTLFYLYLRR